MKSIGEGFSYVVLARKWRPAQFADIVGQGHVVRTLVNAIKTNRIHQAYLFTGSRGIGKTSIARIFAKAIRCENARAENDTYLSCGSCAACKEIASGTSVDVIEIDGASNNGVEAVREIRENAKYMPSTGSRKIYIIDEVHMLTTAAFNALLKTLEEPPAHVIFMFATTEPHKIPATILSRCQRFDLRRVTVTQVQSRLTEVSQSEGLKVESGALALLARAAEGSMRDALSLLDQVIAFSGQTISTQAVRDSIGLIEGETLLGIVQGIFARKPLDALALTEQAYQRGHDLRVLARSLIEFMHAAILAKIGAPGSQSLELSEEEWKELKDAAALRPLEEIEMIFQALHHGLDWIARSPQPKAVLDVLVVKCATAEALVFAESAGTQGAATPPPSTSRPSTAGANSQSAPKASMMEASAPAPAPATPSPAQALVQSLQASRAANAAAPVAPTPQAAASSGPAQAVPAPAIPSGPRSWEGFIEHVRKTRPLLASILEHGSSAEVSVEEQRLALFYKAEESYYLKQIQARTYADQIQSLTKEYFGKQLRLEANLLGEGKDSGESLAEKKARVTKEKQEDARNQAQNHPIIREAQSLFGGELGPIELIDPENRTDAKGGGHADF
jgi:DNA polymerase-3 subunit gamma/tau